MLNLISGILRHGPKPEKLERIPSSEHVMSYGALKRDIDLLPGKISVVSGDGREDDPLERLKYLGSHVVSQINRTEKEELMNAYDAKAIELFESAMDNVLDASKAGVGNPSNETAKRYDVETFPFMNGATRKSVTAKLLAQKQGV